MERCDESQIQFYNCKKYGYYSYEYKRAVINMEKETNTML